MLQMQLAGCSFKENKMEKDALLKYSLTRYQNIRPFLPDLTVVYHSHLPLTFGLVPYGLGGFSVELYVPIKVPFLHRVDYVLLNFLATGVEMRPFRIGIKRKRLHNISLC